MRELRAAMVAKLPEMQGEKFKIYEMKKREFV